VLQKCLKMVFIHFLGGSAWEKTLLPVGSAGNPKICHSSTGLGLPVKEAHITPKKPKEESRPLYTNFATG
jgi:hypothetical protein